MERIRTRLSVIGSIIFIIIIFVVIYTINNDIESINKSQSNVLLGFNELKQIKPVTIQTIQPIQPVQPTQLYRIKDTGQYKLYIHPPGDMVSDRVWQTGTWDDCLTILAVATNKLSNIQKLVIVEVGTNIAACSIPYISKGHKVYGFEPFQPSIELVRKSISENYNLPGELILIEAGASNMKGVSNVFFEQGNLGNSRVGNNKENYNIKYENKYNFYYQKHQQVRLTTIDSVVTEHIHLLKMDCQGFEYFASLGAINLITKYGVDIVVFELTPVFIEANNQKPSDLLHFFVDRNFDLFHSGQNIPKEKIDSFVERIKTTMLDTTIVCLNKNTTFTS